MYNLFQCDIDCDSQTTFPVERRLQFIFLFIIHHMCAPYIICSLPGNYTNTYRDSEKIHESCSDVLPLESLNQLKCVLNRHTPSKFKKNETAE